MKYFWSFFSILIVHLCLGGRVVSIPYAVVLLGDWYPAVWFVWLTDLLFGIPLIHFVLERFHWLPEKIKTIIQRIKRSRRKFSHKEPVERERKFHSDMLRRAQKWGQFGVVIITALPVSGGIWTGVLLAKSLKIKTLRSYLLVALGSLGGCLLFALGVHGIRLLILRVISLFQ